MLDLRTFGGSRGAAHLVHRLNEINNSKLTRNVTNFLIGKNKLVRALEEMPDRAARITFANMLKDHINASHIKDAPELVETLSKNVAIGAIKARIFCEPEYDADDYDIRTVEFEFEEA